MYSVLITELRGEHYSNDHAAAVEFPDMDAFYEQLALDGAPPESLPTLQFRIDPAYLQLDYLGLSNVELAWLCSQRFHDALTSEAVPCRMYPVEAFDDQTNQPVAQRFYLFIPDKIKDAIDLQHSEFYTPPDVARRELTRLVLKPEVVAREHPLFEAGPSINLLIHDRLRARMESEPLTGVAFAPLETVVNPWQGVDVVKLRQQIQQTPGDMAKWFELARLWTGLYRPNEALEALDQALKLSPSTAELWRQRGLRLADLGQDDEAMAAFTHAMELNAADPPGPERPLGARDWAWQGRCELLRKQQQYAEALPLAEEGVQTFPKRVDAWYELGMVQLGLGNQEAALEAFTRAPLMNSPENERVAEQQGALLSQLGRNEEALAVYERATAFDSQNLKLLRGRAEALQALGRQAEAAQAAAALQQTQEIQEQLQKTWPW